MDASIFNKLKVKPGMSASVYGAPEEYPKNDSLQWIADGKPDFLHLFAESKVQFMERFAVAAKEAADGTLFWVSYPKASRKVRYDINRDSLWDLLIPAGWHPVSQVALDEHWSAIRIKPNEAGKEYVRPGNMKAP